MNLEHSPRAEELEVAASKAQSAINAPATFDDQYLDEGLRLLKRYHQLHAKNESLVGQIERLKDSAALRIGREIIGSTKSVRGILGLPLALYRVVKQLGDASSRKERGFDPAVSGPSELFLKKQPNTFELTVIGSKRYDFTGELTSFRKENQKGALATIRFEDELGGALPFKAEGFTSQPRKAQAYRYLTTGVRVPFRLTFIAPRYARRVIISFSRFAEQIPVHLDVNRLALDNVSEAEAKPLSPAVVEKRLRFASILDEFTHECFSPDVDLVSVTKRDWHSQLTQKPVQAFLAESTWRGNDGEWKYAMTKPEKWGREIEDILHFCRSSGIPALFWNKEDPVNFEVFRETARKFDFIFTTDSGSIEAYRELTGHDNAFTLPFAAQPLLHNPIRTGQRIERIAFTGSWRGIKYPRRAEWLDLLLTPIMDRELLDIYDRFSAEKENPDLIFPDKYRKSLRGALGYKDLVSDVYKRYDAFVSVNSVEGSETMLARRVFEILACGAPVISSYSKAIEKTFGDIVLMPESATEVDAAIDRLYTEPLYRERLVARGVREVHSKHTYRHRLEDIGLVTGTPLISKSRRKSTIIVCSKRPDFLSHAAEQIASQTYSEREVIFVKHSKVYQDDDIAAAFKNERDLKILEIGPDNVLADGLNIAIEQSDGEVIAKFDDDDFYGPNYLSDSILAFDYAPQAGLVGKQAFFAYVEGSDSTVHRFAGKSYIFTSRVHGGTFVWDRRKTEGVSFTRTVQGTDTLFLKSLVKKSIPIFSTDPFNFIHVRHADLAKHTWKIEDHEFLSKAKILGKGLLRNLVFV